MSGMDGVNPVHKMPGLAAESAARATGSSDVRMDKVLQLQQAIAGGTYNVPAGAVADKMVERLLS